MFYSTSWVLYSIEDYIDKFNIEEVAIYASVYIVCVIGFTELITANRDKSSLGKILGSAGIALLIIIFIEFLRNLILRENTNIIVRYEWLTGILLISYILLSGFNMIINLDVRKFYSGDTLKSMYLVWFGVNLFVFVSLIALSLMVVNNR